LEAATEITFVAHSQPRILCAPRRVLLGGLDPWINEFQRAFARIAIVDY
jgi:hypothetical protein